MATPLVVGGVARFQVLQHWSNSRKVANIVDMHIFNRGITTSREDAVSDQARIISDAWIANVLPLCPNNLTLDGVRWVDLDTVDGSTGEDSSGAASGGGVTGAAASPNVAILIHKTLAGSARNQRNGRMYIAGASEAHVDEDGLVDTDWTSAMGDFLDDINQDSGVTPPVYDSDMVVVHLGPIVDGVRTGDFHAVDALVGDARCATQRRRLR